uniref:Secreted protein n=1 Tax=Echinostoma caproni TaxID=27848 RepID=A0A182ZZS7_9TREM
LCVFSLRAQFQTIRTTSLPTRTRPHTPITDLHVMRTCLIRINQFNWIPTHRVSVTANQAVVPRYNRPAEYLRAIWLMLTNRDRDHVSTVPFIQN